MVKRKHKPKSRRKFDLKKLKKPKKEERRPIDLSLSGSYENSKKKERKEIPEGLISLIEGPAAQNRRLVVGWFMGKFQKIDDGLGIQVPFLLEAQLDVFYLVPGKYEDCAGQDCLIFNAEPGHGF